MADRASVPRARGLTAIDAAVALMAILLIVQMWLLTATVENALAGHESGAVAGAIVSGVLLAGCAGLLRFVSGVDREVRRGERADSER